MDAIAIPPDHRARIEMIIAERTVVARQFSMTAAVLTVVCVMIIFSAALNLGFFLGLLAAIGVMALAAFILWHLGWRQVVSMQQDLNEGSFATHRGRIDGIERNDNAHGETITTVTVGGIRHTTPDRMFEGLDFGDMVEVDHLPRSAVPLAVRSQSGAIEANAT